MKWVALESRPIVEHGPDSLGSGSAGFLRIL